MRFVRSLREWDSFTSCGGGLHPLAFPFVRIDANHDVKGLLLEGHMRRALPSNRFGSLPFLGASLTVKSVTCRATTSVSPPSLPPPQPPPPQLSLGPQPTLPPLTGEKKPNLRGLCGDRRERRERMPRASIIFRQLALASVCLCTLHCESSF